MSKAALLELADRVERASGPDRELDTLIEIAIDPDNAKMPWSQHAGHVARLCGDQHFRDGHASKFTASLDAAMTLVPKGHLWKVGYSRHVPHVAEVVDYQSHKGSFVAECDSSRAIALTAACLRARAQQESKDA